MRKTMVNIVYNALYQVMALMLPIVVQPYITRTLGREAVGLNAYINSIPVLLAVIIMFGMNQFGARAIAQAKPEELPKRFAHLWFIQLTVGTITILGYVAAVFLFLNHKAYFLLEVPFLIGYILDISWLFIGLGEIKSVVTRNTFIKLAITASLFIFVHKPSDLWIYLLINSVTYLANIVFWLGLDKKLGRRLKHTDFAFDKIYFRGALMVTIPSIAVQLYISFDQTLVGQIAGNTQLSYYGQSQMIARAIITVVGSVSTILMPKMAQMMANDTAHSEVVKLMKTALDYTMLISLYFTIELMLNASKFVVWFWGNAYKDAGPILFVGALIVVLVSYGGVFANQYTLSRGLFKEFAIPYYVGAVLSITLNLLLLPSMGAMGGAITIVLTEATVCFLRIFLVRRELPLKQLFSKQWQLLLAGVIALAIGLITSRAINTGSLFVDLVIQTVVSSLCYLLALIVLRNSTVTSIYARLHQRFAR
ncbi:oligosaccharide flippase family protein [Lacticaseibacillus songhuajiangensis]|uniref:oligosaccharide flippase family protein n=1 Tax=Lacticaseibacillus songhuajiangensis TaxID=1296539 RepID=UPI000F7B94EE|nr:oligosaccharide flippase family protein [Lacticaseibacillus songhuajiangensis]